MKVFEYVQKGTIIADQFLSCCLSILTNPPTDSILTRNPCFFVALHWQEMKHSKAAKQGYII